MGKLSHLTLEDFRKADQTLLGANRDRREVVPV